MVGYRRTPCRLTAFSRPPAARSLPSCASEAPPPPPSSRRSSGSRPMRCASNWSSSSAMDWSRRHAVRRGPTKPDLEFSLTSKADTLFPQRTTRCWPRCCATSRSGTGRRQSKQIFDRIARRTVERVKEKVTAQDPEGKVAQLTRVLRERGVVAEYSLVDDGFVLHEHSCPYSSAAKEHPEVCR